MKTKMANLFVMINIMRNTVEFGARETARIIKIQTRNRKYGRVLFCDPKNCCFLGKWREFVSKFLDSERFSCEQ